MPGPVTSDLASPDQAPTLPVLLVGVLAAFTAQQVLMPALAPLAREVGLSELQLGLVISVAAAMLVATAPIWGRACATLGHKRVLMTGPLVATAGLAGFAAVSQVALAGGLGPGWTFALVLATRGVLFGVRLTAVPGGDGLHLGDHTRRSRPNGRDRTARGRARAVGGARAGDRGTAGLRQARGTLVRRPAGPGSRRTGRGSPGGPASACAATVRRSRRAGRRRAGLALPGHRIHALPGSRAGPAHRRVPPPGPTRPRRRATGAILFACGLVLVLTQRLLVPWLGWGPSLLLRVGTPIAAAGFAGLALAPGFWTIGTAMALVSLGLGLGIPGYTAGPTLQVAATEKGAVAGLVTAINGLTFMIGPAAGAALYQVGPAVPFVTAAATAVAVWVLVLAHPTFRARTRGAAPMPTATTDPR